MFVHGLFGHPQRTWTGRGKRDRRVASSPYQENDPSRLPEESTETSSLLTITDSGSEPGIGEGTSTREPSLQGLEMPPPSSINSSQIIGLQTGDVFWPEAILPGVLPETRIYTWGYDSDIDAFTTLGERNGIEQNAIDLLTDVANLIEKLKDVGQDKKRYIRTNRSCIASEAYHLCRA